MIIDFKRADIDRSNDPYVKLAFDWYKADAATIHHKHGMEAMRPFLERTDKSIIIVVRTSNNGAPEMQDVPCMPLVHEETGAVYANLEEAARERGGHEPRSNFTERRMPHYLFVAHRVAQSWNMYGNCAAVVGATYPSELADVREAVGEMPILVPGIGTQGGRLEDALRYGLGKDGFNVILNNSSGIMFAYRKLMQADGVTPRYEPWQYASAAAQAARKMNESIQNYLQAA